MMFFSTHFILSHFRFALFIFNILCAANMKTQERFTILPVVWSSMIATKEPFQMHLVDLRSGRFHQFECACHLDEEQENVS